MDLIQRVTSNDASVLEDGKAQYSCLPNTTGGIVDDLLVYCVGKNKVYMLVVNASNIEKDWNWISSYNTKGVEMHNISAKTALLAVQGPKATQIVQQLTDMDVLNMPYYSFAKGKLLGIDNVLISATGYTGAGGVEIYFEDVDDNASKVWDALFEKGAAFGIQPIGLGARDTLRLEMGFCLTTNGVFIGEYIDALKKLGVRHLNLSLDSLDRDRFKQITRRDDFAKVYENLHRLIDAGFQVKINAVS